VKQRTLNDERFRDVSNISDDSLREWRAFLMKQWATSAFGFLTAVDPTTIRTDGKTNYVWNTTDEREKINDPEKPFPTWLYLAALFWLMEKFSVLGVEKSRQVLATTAVLAFAFHEAAFKRSRKTLVSKATLPEAQEIIEAKIRVPWGRMPPWIREMLWIDDKPASKIRFPNSGSQIIAVAENAAVRTMRGVTASRVIVDEAAFQKFFDAMMRSALPMAASIVALTSADGGEVGGQAFIEHFSLNNRERMTPFPIDFDSFQKSGELFVPAEWAGELANL